MKLCLLLTILSLVGLAWTWPGAVQEPAQALAQDQALAAEQDQGLVSLQDVADVGSEHDNAGARNARFLWGGYWGRPWYGGYYYYRYPRYRRYYNYWW